MSMTWEEAAYEEAMEALYAEHKEQAIEEFTEERLQSYYFTHLDVAVAATQALVDSRQFLSQHPTAGFIFAAIAMEVGLKGTLLKPVVYGLVHSESIAGIITDMVIGHSSLDRFGKLLFRILSEYGGVDLNSFKREGSSKTLWEEIKGVQKQRNRVMHLGERVTTEAAEGAVAVASSIIEELFPKIVTKLGFHTHEDGRVCNDWRCKNKDPIEDLKLLWEGGESGE